TGALDFSDTAISASGAIKGQFLGGAVTIGGGIGDQQEGLSLRGRATAAALADYVDLQGMRRLEGQLDYHGRLRRSQDKNFLLDVASDLQGLALDFPPPLGKTAQQTLPLTVGWGRRTDA